MPRVHVLSFTGTVIFSRLNLGKRHFVIPATKAIENHREKPSEDPRKTRERLTDTSGLGIVHRISHHADALRHGPRLVARVHALRVLGAVVGQVQQVTGA